MQVKKEAELVQPRMDLPSACDGGSEAYEQSEWRICAQNDQSDRLRSLVWEEREVPKWRV